MRYEGLVEAKSTPAPPATFPLPRFSLPRSSFFIVGPSFVRILCVFETQREGQVAYVSGFIEGIPGTKYARVYT